MKNWGIALVDRDGQWLFLGENAFGSLTHQGAMVLAHKVGSRTGVCVIGQEEAQAG